MAEIELIQGGTHTDERGTVSFVNDFSPKVADRFYTIRAAKTGVPRGWIGHRIEHKWFIAFSGKWLIAAVKPDNWETPSPSLPVQQLQLFAEKPSILHIPSGHACAMVMLTTGGILGVFSTGDPEQLAKDDWRYPIEIWRVLH